jgi:DNA-binding NarL/FixJ family response regulator
VLKYNPDVIIMDIRMKGNEDGIYALYQVKKTNPFIKVMMLTTFDMDDKIFNSICLGADGYMLKTDFSSYQNPQDAILKSLGIIFDGGAYLTPSVAKKIMGLFFSGHSIVERIQAAKEKFGSWFNKDSKGRVKTNTLSKMQIKVLEEIIEGKSTSEIAKALFLSENTINTHIKGIYNFLGVHSRAKAVKMAMDARLISNGDRG